MNRFSTLLVIAALISCAVTSAEAETVKRTRLSNGLTIISKPTVSNKIVSVVVSLKLGSLYESDEQAGLATLMQDTILKGTESRSSEQIALELESMGTRLSTSANREYGTLSLQSTSESLSASLEILFDILTNATFPEDSVELQKKLQSKNILMRNDQPLYRAIDLLVEAHYGEHPFHKPRLGYDESIAKLTRDDIVSMYGKMYMPNNMVITAVGNFDEKQLIADVDAALGSLSKGSEPIAVAGERTAYKEPSVKIEERETAASWFALGWPSAEMDSDDLYAMEMLNGITGGSMNSRLFVAIREERGLAYQVSSFVNARKESGIYIAYIGTKPTTYEEARTVLIEEVRRMAEEKAAPAEIKNAKSFLKGMNVMGQESNSGQASLYGHYEILGLGYEFPDRYNAGIDAVTEDDILAAGKKYLTGPYSQGAVLAK